MLKSCKISKITASLFGAFDYFRNTHTHTHTILTAARNVIQIFDSASCLPVCTGEQPCTSPNISADIFTIQSAAQPCGTAYISQNIANRTDATHRISIVRILVKIAQTVDNITKIIAAISKNIANIFKIIATIPQDITTISKIIVPKRQHQVQFYTSFPPIFCQPYYPSLSKRWVASQEARVS